MLMSSERVNYQNRMSDERDYSTDRSARVFDYLVLVAANDMLAVIMVRVWLTDELMLLYRALNGRCQLVGHYFHIYS